MVNLKILALGLIFLAALGNCDGSVIVGNGNRVTGNNNFLHDSDGNNINGDNNSLENSFRNQIDGDLNRFFASNDLRIHGHRRFFNYGE